MAIKVIRPGNKDWEPLFRGTCQRCKCCLECRKEDGEYVGPFRSGTEGDFVKVVCPNCKMTIICYRAVKYPGSDWANRENSQWLDR